MSDSIRVVIVLAYAAAMASLAGVISMALETDMVWPGMVVAFLLGGFQATAAVWRRP